MLIYVDIVPNLFVKKELNKELRKTNIGFNIELNNMTMAGMAGEQVKEE